MNNHLKSIAVHSCKNYTYTQLCKNCTAQVRLIVLPVDKVFVFSFLKTAKLQIFNRFIFGGFMRKIQQMTRRPDR